MKNPKKMILTVTLNPALDKIYLVPGWRAGCDHRVSQAITSAGGKGINLARALKGLGVQSQITGIIGGATGRDIRRILLREGLTCDFYERAVPTRMTVTIINHAQYRVTRLIEEGYKVTKEDIRRFVRKFVQLIKACDLVSFCGSPAPGIAPGIYFELMGIASRAGKRTVLDTSGQPLTFGLKARPYLVKPNQEEAEAILKRKLRRSADLVSAVCWFLKKGAQQVVISLGKKGAVGSNGEGVWLAEPPALRTINPVGCGDVLLAGFLFTDCLNKFFPESLINAVAAGAANALTVVPGDLRQTAVARVLRGVTLRRLA